MHDPDVTNYEKLATLNLLSGQNLVLFFSMFLVKKVKVRKLKYYVDRKSSFMRDQKLVY